MTLFNSVPIAIGDRCHRSGQAMSLVTTLPCRISDCIWSVLILIEEDNEDNSESCTVLWYIHLRYVLGL